MNAARLRADVSASLVVFLVALPLAMGIALASGAPLAAGLIAAAAGGLIGGALGGAPLMVSGPAAGLAVIVFELIDRHGMAALGAMTVLAGLLQVAMGFGRVARLATVLSPAVLQGMLAGIGVLLVVAQLHVMMGSSPGSSFFANVRGLLPAAVHANPEAAAIGALTLGLLLAWPKLRWLARSPVPPALGAVGAATAVAAALDLDVPRVALAADVFALTRPAMPAAGAVALMAGAITLALVASAESLLSAVAVDKLHDGPRADLNRELIGQGAANFVSGLIGGLPITGVIVRSTAGIEAGARTRLATILHGAWIVLAALLLGNVLNKVPLAALAALLVLVGTKLVNARAMRELWARGEAGVGAVTLAGVVGINLLAGIGLGFAAALTKLAWQLGRAHLQLAPATDGAAWRLSVRGPLTFLGVPRLQQLLATVPPGAALHIELDGEMVDHAADEALASFAQSHGVGGGQVLRAPHLAGVAAARAARSPARPRAV